ncbi:MAG: four helix bundle protein [Planctomycetaceae bacterium]|nr:four helix bundle protein [Planctomycetaceae bacterium]MBV8384692.1 four helix bundle protein [Planctomycetaceae bacterium]MBV8557499.1 four helix bundle protein [Planctomycetaceae bacterium]
MKYKRFEELPVWDSARELAIRIFGLTATGVLKNYSGLRDQLERAGLSVSNNIAEGFDRGTNAELLTFLYIARGSSAETRSMLLILSHLINPKTLESGISNLGISDLNSGMSDRGSEISNLESEISNLIALSESISRQLGAWIESLKNSKLKGTRYQDGTTRQRAQDVQRRDAFMNQIRRLLDEHRGGDGRRDSSEPSGIG